MPPLTDSRGDGTDRSCDERVRCRCKTERRTLLDPQPVGSDRGLVGATYTVSGCGFAPGSLVPLNVTEADGCCMALNMVADAYGRFSYTDDVWAPGTYGVRAWVLRNGSGRWRLAAEWWFEAYP
jgi:hypothetical protein